TGAGGGGAGHDAVRELTPTRGVQHEGVRQAFQAKLTRTAGVGAGRGDVIAARRVAHEDADVVVGGAVGLARRPRTERKISHVGDAHSLRSSLAQERYEKDSDGKRDRPDSRDARRTPASPRAWCPGSQPTASSLSAHGCLMRA